MEDPTSLFARGEEVCLHHQVSADVVSSDTKRSDGGNECAAVFGHCLPAGILQKDGVPALGMGSLARMVPHRGFLFVGPVPLHSPAVSGHSLGRYRCQSNYLHRAVPG